MPLCLQMERNVLDRHHISTSSFIRADTRYKRKKYIKFLSRSTGIICLALELAELLALVPYFLIFYEGNCAMSEREGSDFGRARVRDVGGVEGVAAAQTAVAFATCYILIFIA